MGLIGAFLPYGLLQKGLTPDNPWSSIVMTGVSIPAYITPFESMMQFQLVVRDGYSIGAAFAIIFIGAGASVGVASWLLRDYGLKPMLLFLTLVCVYTLSLGMLADRTIAQGKASAADHTHAFDGFTRVHSVPQQENGAHWVYERIRRDIHSSELVGIAILVAFGFLGILTLIAGKHLSADEILKNDPRLAQRSSWNPSLPGWVLTSITFAGAIAGFTTLGYVFFPPAKELFGDISNVRVAVYDAIREKNADEMIRMGFMWEDFVRKVPTSVLMRLGHTPPDVQASVDEMLYALDMLHDYAEDEAYQKAKTIELYLEETHRACRHAAEKAMGF